MKEKKENVNKQRQQLHFYFQDLNDLFPWVLERVFGSLDGATVGWGLLQCHEGDAIRKLLQPRWGNSLAVCPLVGLGHALALI